MVKGIKQTRKSIAHRNKMRKIGSKRSSIQQIRPSFPQEEEKHGYFPSFLDSPLKNKAEKKRNLNFVLKGTLSVFLFSGVALLLQTDFPLLSKPKEWTSHALTEEFPFARVNQWYQATFGTPLSFTPKINQIPRDEEVLALPVSGNVTESFQANGTGIMITPKKATTVTAWHEGVIIFAGNDRETNKTVIIQHADKSKSTYGLLSSIDVHLYQFVEANQRIGVSNPIEEDKAVFFSIKKDNNYIDPVQVIKVDDLP